MFISFKPNVHPIWLFHTLHLLGSQEYFILKQLLVDNHFHWLFKVPRAKYLERFTRSIFCKIQGKKWTSIVSYFPPKFALVLFLRDRLQTFGLFWSPLPTGWQLYLIRFALPYLFSNVDIWRAPSPMAVNVVCERTLT